MKTPREWARECMSRIGIPCPDVSPTDVIEVIVMEALAAERDRLAKSIADTTEKYRTFDFTGSDTIPSVAYELGRCDQGLLDANLIRGT